MTSRLSVWSALLVLVSGQAITTSLASASTSTDRVYWTLDELVANSPAPWPSQAVADELMMKHRSNDAFVGIYVDAPDAVRVVLKDGDEREVVISDIKVTFTATKYSLNELFEYSQMLRDANWSVHEIEIQADQQLLLVMVAPGAAEVIDKSNLPPDIAAAVSAREPEQLTAAHGGQLVTGNNCTSGFRMNTNRISTASHCSDTWGNINGIAITHQSSSCARDNQWGSGSSLSTSIPTAGPFSGMQGDPATGSLVYKYGVQTGWTYGYVGNYGSVFVSCTVQILEYSGGNMASVGGDSGGPYISNWWNGTGYSYIARGTHRGHSGSTMHSIPMSSLNNSGWYVQ